METPACVPHVLPQTIGFNLLQSFGFLWAPPPFYLFPHRCGMPPPPPARRNSCVLPSSPVFFCVSPSPLTLELELGWQCSQPQSEW